MGGRSVSKLHNGAVAQLGFTVFSFGIYLGMVFSFGYGLFIWAWPFPAFSFGMVFSLGYGVWALLGYAILQTAWVELYYTKEQKNILAF